MHIETLVISSFEVNSYIIIEGKDAVVVDPGWEVEVILQYLKEKDLTLQAIVNTHLHFDHVYGNAPLSKATGVSIYAHAGDEDMKKSDLGTGAIFGAQLVEEYTFIPLEEKEYSFGEVTFSVLHTPGHSPGSICLYCPKAGSIIVGDVIFYRSIGRTDFSLGSQELLLNSIKEKIFTLPSETIIYPGHGIVTNVADEMAENQFVK